MYKEKIQALINAMNISSNEYSKEDMLEVENILNGFGEYVRAVLGTESANQIAKFRLDGEEYRNHIENLDKYRSSVHNSCIVNIKLLNKFCTLYKTEEIFTKDILNMNRVQLAEYIIKPIVDEYFEKRIR